MNILVSNAGVITLSWLAVVAHVAVGVFAWRRGSVMPLVPVLNFIMAFLLALYWGQRLSSALMNGRVWYATDQVWLVYGLVVCVVSALALSGRVGWNGFHWAVFGAHAVVSVGAAVFFSFVFRINRLM